MRYIMQFDVFSLGGEAQFFGPSMPLEFVEDSPVIVYKFLVAIKFQFSIWMPDKCLLVGK